MSNIKLYWRKYNHSYLDGDFLEHRCLKLRSDIGDCVTVAYLVIEDDKILELYSRKHGRILIAYLARKIRTSSKEFRRLLSEHLGKEYVE